MEETRACPVCHRLTLHARWALAASGQRPASLEAVWCEDGCPIPADDLERVASRPLL